jgi:2-polyprenyl-3-methyl-5-hydroxy-6-metoxy-1,4-benzoquinol methylase
MVAVENIINNVKSKDNLWAVNTEDQYHEKLITSVENLVEAYTEKDNEGQMNYDPDTYWKITENSYPYYPTVRHRKRFIVNSLKELIAQNKNLFVFDYGCGEGSVLNEVKRQFQLRDRQLGGCDISKRAVGIAKREVHSPYLYCGAFPELYKKCDVIICSEVIEHTKNYLDVLRWIKNNIADGGFLILSTQAGKIHASDKYTGHTQHFDISQLNSMLRQLEFKIEYSRQWGFPFFSLQKYVTDLSFDSVRKNYLEGALSVNKRFVFGVAYLLYFINNLMDAGPQIYIIASKNSEGT